MGYKNVLGTAALIIAMTSYVPYIRDIIKRRTHPHAFSWLTWSTLSGISFGVQITHHGGAGAWVWGFVTFGTLAVFVLSLMRGERNIVLIDWLSLSGAALALILWVATSQPLASVILISIVEALGGFFPTFRKSYMHPEKETLSMYVLSILYTSLSVFALEKFSIVNVFYPTVCILLCIGMTIFLPIRRIQLDVQPAK